MSSLRGDMVVPPEEVSSPLLISAPCPQYRASEGGEGFRKKPIARVSGAVGAALCKALWGKDCSPGDLGVLTWRMCSSGAVGLSQREQVLLLSGRRGSSGGFWFEPRGCFRE